MNNFISKNCVSSFFQNLREQGQCDQKKNRQKLPKNGFTRKMIYFETFTKIAKNVGDLAKLIAAKGFKSCPKSNKSPNLVTLNKEEQFHDLDFAAPF